MKRASAAILFVLVIGIAGLLAQEATPEGPAQFSGELALQHIANYMSGGPLPSGTANNLRVGNRILDYLAGLGWETSEDWHLLDFGPEGELSDAARQTLADWQPITLAGAINGTISASVGEQNANLNYDQVVVPIRNLVASFGSGPTIIIGAHYDSRLYADRDPDATKLREPVPAANDGGSGVGVLMELARVISENYAPNNEIRLVFFDAEDNGRIEPFTQLYGGYANGYLLGSVLYASGLDRTTEQIEYMVLVDMVGDDDQRLPMEGYSVQYAPDLTGAIWATASELGYGDIFLQETRSPITDDHQPFWQLGIPAVDIIDLDYPYWHTTGDTLDKISPDSLERVGRVLQRYLEQSGAITPLSE